MNKIYRILVLLLALVVIIPSTLASDLQEQPSEQKESALEQPVPTPGVQDYTCVAKTTAKSPPPVPSFIKVDKDVKKTSLCSEGKLPKSLTTKDMDIHIGNVQYNPKNKTDSNIDTAICGSYYGRCYDRAISKQYVDNIGASAYLTQHSPAIDYYNGYHSVARIGVENDISKNSVSVGWIRIHDSTIPRLFTNWLIYDSPQCQNCGWVQTSNYYYPGMLLSTTNYGVGYLIENIGGDWWIMYNGEWLGYYPGYLWNGRFNQGNVVIYNGEVASKIPVTTTDMGNGLWASNYNAARIEDQRYIYAYDNSWYNAYTDKWSTSPNLYSVAWTSSNSMRYGGPGGTGAISVLTPNGGESWPKGTTRLIKWGYAGNIGSYIKIDLLKGGIYKNTITSYTPNDGYYDWPISSATICGNDYKIKITSINNPALTDVSDRNFAITGCGSYITVVSPNGGEIWFESSTKEIKWTYTGNPGYYVKIELLKGGIVNRVISSGTVNDKSLWWTIPWSQTPGADYKIRITSTSNSAYRDTSNNNFRIY